jgi:hypothetical protein
MQKPQIVARSGLVVILFMPILQSCGAPTRSASEVSSDLKSTQSLDERLNNTCQYVMQNDVAKRALEKIEKPCEDAGLYATNLLETKSLNIRGIDKIAPVEDDGAEYINASTQVWLERSLFSISLTVLSTLSNDTTSVFQSDTRQDQDLPDFASDAGTLTLPEIPAINFEHDLMTGSFTPKELGKATTNPIKIEQSMTLETNGIISTNLDIDIVATVAKESMALIVSSKAADSSSFLSDLHMVFFIIPYANETYLHSHLRLGVKTGGWANVGRDALKSLIEKTLIEAIEDITENQL